MDKISIKDLQVFSNHGAMPEEKILGQKFLVSADFYLDFRDAGLEDDLSKTLDYSKACKAIVDFMGQHTFDLIEAVAEQLGRTLLLEFAPLLREVEITIKKPWAPVGLPLEYCQVSARRKWHDAYLSVGSNMGDRQAYITDGISALENNPLIRVVKASELIETKPYGGVEQGDFLNGALHIRTLLTPEELLRVCQEIEQKADRKREIHWGPRTLDMDIVFYDQEIIVENNPSLEIPHPDMHNRLFVLEPLNEIAPGYVHPLLSKTVRYMYDALRKKE